ncbi:MAG: hypothetical protein K1X88_03405 [Nannocystaceae bacterium]|nr:hypothetical protein [Nannocystaceae bacterium]
MVSTTAGSASTQGATDSVGSASASASDSGGSGSSSGDASVSASASEAGSEASDGSEASGASLSAGSGSEGGGASSSDGGPDPVCGDGNVDPGEACDDGNGIETDACLPGCVAASCGDGIVHEGAEVCDDGVNDGSYGGCNAGCGSLAPYCGDASVQAQEQCDPGVALPYQNFDCGPACVYDFSGITQLYCNGSCSWAGADSCDQGDADIFCKLVTGDSTSTANSYSVVTALDAPGFSCPGYGNDLGTMPGFGVNVDVWYQDTSILANHGAGQVVTAANCT